MSYPVSYKRCQTKDILCEYRCCREDFCDNSTVNYRELQNKLKNLLEPIMEDIQQSLKEYKDSYTYVIIDETGVHLFTRDNNCAYELPDYGGR